MIPRMGDFALLLKKLVRIQILLEINSDGNIVKVIFLGIDSSKLPT